MSKITELHDGVRRGNLADIKMLLEADRSLANARSETDLRGTHSLHVAAEFGKATAAQLLLDYGADVKLLDSENDATARLELFVRAEASSKIAFTTELFLPVVGST